MAQLSSSKAKAVALAMTGLAATSLSTSTAFGQSAQQITLHPACERLPAAQSAQCYYDKALADARNRTVAANQEGACSDQLLALRTKDPAVVERGRAILAGRSLRDFGACNLLGRLNNS